jgi:predicted RNA binding protein YcfA (HicA-like mRNA interferase family)
MIKDELRLIIPNPHEGDVSKSLLSKILRQAQVSKDEWEAL